MWYYELTKGDTLMKEIDKELYLEILLALGGYHIKDKENFDIPCQSNCQPVTESPENTDV